MITLIFVIMDGVEINKGTTEFRRGITKQGSSKKKIKQAML